MNLKQLFNKYEKGLLQEICDMVFIEQRILPEKVRLILIKYGVIKKSTKIILAYFNKNSGNLVIKNGNYKTIIDAIITPEKIQELLNN